MFDTTSDLRSLQAETKAIRKPRFVSSRLDRYTAELLALSQAGATIAELRRWLLRNRIKVHHTTVSRWLAKNT